jgi:cytochrome b involved in lipid metabolism
MYSQNRGFSSLLLLLVLAGVAGGGYFYYTSQSSKQTQDTKEAVHQDSVREVAITQSGNYGLPLPAGWTYIVDDRKNSAGEFKDVYVFDENDRIVMEIFSPRKETPKGVVVGGLAGFVATDAHPLSYYSVNPDPNYSYDSQTEFDPQKDGWTEYHWSVDTPAIDSLDILVYFGVQKTSDIYQRTRPDAGHAVRYASYADFDARRAEVESVLKEIYRVSGEEKMIEVKKPSASAVERARFYLNTPHPLDNQISGYDIDRDRFPADMLYPDGGGTENDISMTEVSRHANANDCWIVLDNSAHDITGLLAYSDEHKAIQTLSSLCGTDVSAVAEVSPVEPGSINTARVRYALSPLFIGFVERLVTQDSPVTGDVVVFKDLCDVGGVGRLVLLSNKNDNSYTIGLIDTQGILTAQATTRKPMRGFFYSQTECLSASSEEALLSASYRDGSVDDARYWFLKIPNLEVKEEIGIGYDESEKWSVSIVSGHVLCWQTGRCRACPRWTNECVCSLCRRLA